MEAKSTEGISRFKFKEVLGGVGTNSLSLLGTVDAEDAVVVLTKITFSSDASPWTACISASNVIAHLSSTDIYSNLILSATDQIKCTLIHPASQSQIKKYSKCRRLFVHESAELYREKVLPLAISNGIRTKWISIIFDQCAGREAGASFRTRENEDILYYDPEFVIHPDLKWAQTSTDDIYLLVLFRDTSLYTVREIRRKDIPTLKRAEEKVKHVLKCKYGLDMRETRLYFHYHPTFYQLHLHVTSINTSVFGMAVGNAVLLHDVFENIRVNEHYYRDRTMQFLISELSPIADAFRDQFRDETVSEAVGEAVSDK